MVTTESPLREKVLEPGRLTRVSWGAIFAGVACSLGIMVLLSLLGLAIGFGVVDPMQDQNPASGIPTGSAIWFGVSTLVALFAGGYVGARFAGIPIRMTAMLHGAVIWAISTIAMVYMGTTSLGYAVSGASTLVSQASSAAASAGSGLGSTIQSAASSALQAAPEQMPPEVRRALERRDLTAQDVRQELREIMNNAGLGQQDVREATGAAGALAEDIASSPRDARADIQAFVDQLYGGENAVISDDERQQAISTLQQRTGMTEEEATQLWQSVEQRMQTAQEQVTQALETARQEALQASEAALDALTVAAWAAFIASLLGLVAAIIGGSVGKPDDMPVAQTA